MGGRVASASWKLSQGGFDLLARNGSADVPNGMSAFALANRYRDRGDILGPFQAHEHQPAVSVDLYIQHIALVNPGLLSGLGRDDHLTPAINNGSHKGSAV